MRVLWHPAASADAVRIWRYIRREGRPLAAQSVFERIEAAAARLTLAPDIGRRRGSSPNIRELVMSDLPYVLTYRVDRENGLVQILRIKHGAQKPDA